MLSFATLRLSPLACQIVVAGTGLTGLAIAPPAQGKMMLVPMTAAAAAVLPMVAGTGGSRIVGGGPVTGSLVVDGDRAALFAAAWRSAILVIAAPSVGCAGRSAAK